MSTVFEWNIIKCNNKNIGEKSRVIHNIEYELIGTSGPQKEKIRGGEEINTSDLSNFTEWDNVTKTQVIGWLESTIGPSAIQTMKNLIQQRLDSTTSNNPF